MAWRSGVQPLSVVAQLDVGARRHQRLEDGEIGVPRREMEGRPAGLGDGVGVGAPVFQQRLYRFELSGRGRGPERGVVDPPGAREESGRERGGEDQSACRSERVVQFGKEGKRHVRRAPAILPS